MKFWLEVTGQYQWELRKNGEIGLHAPTKTRYKNMLRDIKIGDIVIHYITAARASGLNLRSSIVGISKAKSNMKINGNRYVVDVEKVLKLPIPIKFKEYSKIKNPSEKFKFLIRTNLQKYIFEIEKSDLIKILELNIENKDHVLQSNIFREIFK